MQINVKITISDDTTEEQLLNAGLDREYLHDIYHRAFSEVLEAATAPCCQTSLDITVEDNTKEPERSST